jgi:hypothetical protein
MAIQNRQIGWSQESNLLWQILKQINKLTSVIFGLKEAATPKYKVYTALLTQSGGDGENGDNGGTAVGNYPELVIGRTYYIVDNFQLECDFTNVGAPNNNVGTSFVATGTTPASWGTYGELRYNTGAPVVTVLENTIGNIWFTYEGTGSYHINSDGLFVDGKTFVIIGDSYDGGANGAIIASYYQNLDIIIISSAAIDFSSSAIVGLDGLLFKTPIEIRVYN